jgi:hypothetical protein
MSELDLRDALLKLAVPPSVEAELSTLRGLVKAENSRADRLRFWTIAVWAAFLGILLALTVAAPFSIVRAPALPAGAAQPAIPAAPAEPQGLSLREGAGLFLALMLLLLLAGLPMIGIVLLICLVLARRSATLSQLRASVAGIDAQLKLLATAHRSP